MTPLFIRSDVVKLQASFSENKRSFRSVRAESPPPGPHSPYWHTSVTLVSERQVLRDCLQSAARETCYL